MYTFGPSLRYLRIDSQPFSLLSFVAYKDPNISPFFLSIICTFEFCLLSLFCSWFPCLPFHLFFCAGKKRERKRIMSHEHSHHLPCLHCHPHSYIRMVQHLIERCLILRMSCDDCIKALSRHASIQPLVTLTVWKELLKENKDFFQTYLPASSSPRPFNSTGTPSTEWVPRLRRRKHY